MFKTFSFGIVLGVILTAVAAWYLPVADLTRELSLISVQPNGGNAEVFRIHIPDDRIVGGGNDTAATTPPQLTWPDVDAIDGVELEVFKLRNRDDVVIGLASRIAAESGELEWALHLPARGSIYVPMASAPNAAGQREGRVRAGTREFSALSGSVQERFVLADGQDRDGYIELQSRLIAAATGEDE